MARQTLGRGLSALLSETPADEVEAVNPSGSTLELDIDLIEPNPEQPRTRFAEENLEELAQSIRINGVVQPIVVRKVGNRYQIVAGERRWRASQRAELRRIPSVIKDVTDEKMLELALVENIQRQELNPIEEAKAFRRLIDQLGFTQEIVADRVGKSRNIVATAIRLLQLPDDIRRKIEEGKLSAGHGRALLTTDDPKIQREVANSAVDFGLSVRETEKAIKRLVRHPSQLAKPERAATAIDANVRAAETKLKRSLNTNVKIQPGKKGLGGKIEIEYYSTEDLDRIFQLLMKQ